MVTAAFLARELGDLDDLTSARILALQPTEHDVVEAREWLDGEEEVEAALGGPTSGTVERIVRILRESWDRDEGEEPAPGP